MTEKDEFIFGENEEAVGNEAAPAEVSTAKKKGSPRRLILLLVLLLVIAGAGAYFYLGTEPAPEPPPPAPKKQTIAVPSPPSATEQPIAAPAPPKPAPVKLEAAQAKPEAAAPVETAGKEAPQAAEKVPPAATPPAQHGPYVLQAGAFLVKANLREAEAKVRRLGFEPRMRTVKRSMPMIRLRVGVFPHAEGKAKLKELAAIAPDAFLLQKGEYAVVYAASYYDLDRARRFADILYQQGVRVEEEQAEAKIPLTLLSFGDFADPAAAREVGARARSAGLEATVAKNH